jgi:predicted RNase H-like HicB family nuclease
VVIEACEEGGYFAWCPILQGCHAERESYAEVIENIEDVIKAHIEIRKKHGEFVSSIELKSEKRIDVNLPIFIRD